MPPAFENIQWRTYILFGVFCICMFIHTFFMFPETAGKRLEEVEDMFTDPNGPRYIGTWAFQTRSGHSTTVAMEHGDLDAELAEKRVSGESGSPERKAEV